MSFRNYYDSSSYSRSQSRGATSSPNDRPTSVTAKYINSTPSYKSSNIPVLNSTPKDESPISAIANRYANYGKTDKTSKYDYGKTEKPTTKYDTYGKLDKTPSKYDSYSKTDKSSSSSKYDSPKYDSAKYEKKDYSKLTVPSVTGKSRDVSPVSTTSKYSYNRPSRHLSPERRTKSFKDKSRDPSPADRDKDIPSKTDKSSGYNSLSSYKLYSRTPNYTRPASRAETKPDISLNRYTMPNRLSTNYLRSPPTVKRTSVSPINHSETPKSEIEKSVSPIVIVEEADPRPKEEENEKPIENGIDDHASASHDQEEIKIETETVTVITRHTSPTPPGSSAYVRSRRADMAKTIEKSITRLRKRPEMIDKEIQSDRLDDPTRTSRFAGTTRASVTNWSYYSPNSYTGYAGRYSTQYSNLRENSTPNSFSESPSRGRSSEPSPTENSNSLSDSCSNLNSKPMSSNGVPESNQEIIAVYEHNNSNEMPDIIINVNLKLKRATSPMVAASAELVSPEVTITNSQLPPQPPKPEGGTKPKKIKVRKSSTDSSESGPKKKVVKKRSKSVSSTDSDQGSEASDKNKSQSVSPPKSVKKTSSGSNLTNGTSKAKHSKSRESNSPESSITLSTQSSVSEDEPISRSKTNDVSRTSADEISIPTDRSLKQSSPIPQQKNDPGTEEAKSFLIRALAPVTNLFKIRHQESNENSRWPESSSSESTGKDVSNLITESDKSSKSKNIVASNEDNLVKLKSIRPIESGERAWWLDSESDKKSSENLTTPNTPSDKNAPRKIRHIESGERAWWLESNSESKSENQMVNNHVNNNNVHSENSDSNKNMKKCKFIEEEKPWWLDSSANIPEGIERLTPPRKSSSDSDKSEKYHFYKVRRMESGDQKDWWLTSNENSTNSNNKSDLQHSLSKSGSDQKSFPLKRIRHVESGERPWWLSSDKNIPEGIEKLPTPPPQPESDSSDSEEVQVYIPPSVPPFPLHLPDDEPLGDRRSPEGLETPRENEDYRGRTSPYENNRQYRRRSLYQKGMDRYISRYTDIDDILGTSGQIYSPFMDSILARRTGQIPFDDDDECKEIDPTQVRIHDSTAQMPVIMKIRGR